MQKRVKSFGLFLFALCLLMFVPLMRATIFGSIRGVVHDPQHRPIQDANVDLKAQRSDWVQHQQTNGDGEFEFSAVPLGEYTVTIKVFRDVTAEVKVRVEKES